MEVAYVLAKKERRCFVSQQVVNRNCFNRVDSYNEFKYNIV